ncbi:MAG TPA: hypothetical protein VEX70_02585 [Pyrinomonadaceae bacterium]|nr:hypothetical protein [Pyrinomonadaceae bacterium]
MRKLCYPNKCPDEFRPAAWAEFLSRLHAAPDANHTTNAGAGIP